MEDLRTIVVDYDDLQLILDGLIDTILTCQEHGFSHDDVTELHVKLKELH